MTPYSRAKSLVALLLLVLLTMTGCGGGGVATTRGTPHGTGTAEFTVVWPPPSDAKLIPMASTAVKLDVMQGSTRVGGAVAVKAPGGAPTTVKVENLPVGSLTVNAEAYPEANFDGDVPTVSGTPQAKGTAPLVTEAGKTAKTTLTMASTIVRLAISPNPAQVRIGVGNRITLVSTGYDAEDRVVLRLPEAQSQWAVADPQIAGINSRLAVVEGFQEGTTTVTVTDTENGKTATATLRVVKEALVDRVELSPPSANLEAGASVTLVAKAFDASDTDLGYAPDRFTWTSSLPAIASVDASGKVTGSEVQQETSVTVTATEPTSGKTASSTVVVKPKREGAGRIFFFPPQLSAICSVRPDGTDLQEHMRYADTDFPQTVSPDGSKIVFTRFDDSAENLDVVEVWICNLDRSAPQRLRRWEVRQGDPEISLGNFAVSPDNRRVAFRYGAGDVSGIMVLSTVGDPPVFKDRQEMPDTMIAPGELQWSPDGRRLTFSTVFQPSNDPSVAVWNTVSGDVRKVGRGVYKGTFLPDGERFHVVVKEDSFVRVFIVEMGPDGTVGPHIVRGGLNGHDVDRDKRQIVYTSLDNGSVYNTYVANIDGSNPRQILDSTPGSPQIILWSKP